MCERTGVGAGETEIRGVYIGQEMGNLLCRKSCLLSHKTHESFGQLGNYIIVLVIILHVERMGRPGDGAG